MMGDRSQEGKRVYSRGREEKKSCVWLKPGEAWKGQTFVFPGGGDPHLGRKEKKKAWGVRSGFTILSTFLGGEKAPYFGGEKGEGGG